MRLPLSVWFFLLAIAFGNLTLAKASPGISSTVQLATFDIDVTPPIGSMMAYDPVQRHDALTLRCRGVILRTQEAPIVLCAIDWIGVANEAHDRFRQEIADAAGTTKDRVALHALHQHDAPRVDFTAEQVLLQYGATNLGPFHSGFARQVLKRLRGAVEDALKSARPVTHVGFGTAKVEKVASNRRLLDATGKVWATRYTTCRDAKMRAEPEGVIDPELSCVVFYSNDQPIASLTYFACHPQSYYRTGVPSSDFPGIARFLRTQDSPDVFPVHFNGAGGNIGAGKYNDGKKENRMILAGRVADAMQKAFAAAKPVAITSREIGWDSQSVVLQPAPHLDKEQLISELEGGSLLSDRTEKAAHLAWLLRCQQGHQIDLTCLRLGTVRILHMPGELFVEYQLAAKAMRPDLHVAMAAYGDYGTGYIGTEVAYSQGGYETSARASRVDKSCEQVLMEGMKQLLQE